MLSYLTRVATTLPRSGVLLPLVLHYAILPRQYVVVGLLDDKVTPFTQKKGVTHVARKLLGANQSRVYVFLSASPTPGSHHHRLRWRDEMFEREKAEIGNGAMK
jgi:hypothetical protein